MSMKVAESIGLLYELNAFFPVTIIKTLHTLLIRPFLYCQGQYQNGRDHIKIIPLKSPLPLKS